MTIKEQARSWTAELVDCASRFDAERGGPEWLRKLRRSGRDLLNAQGLPLGHDDDWIYTNIRPLLAERFMIGEAKTATRTGRWQPLSAADPPSDIAITGYPEHAFTALNQAFADSGIRIFVDTDEPRLIEIVHGAINCPNGPGLYADTVRVELASGARATILERWETADRSGAELHLPATDIVIAPGATLRHYRLAPVNVRGFTFASLRASVGSDALFDLVLVGGEMAIDRTEVTVALQASGACVRLGGAAVLSGPLHSAIHTCVQHRAPDCSSDQLFKSVLLDGARSAFQGTIDVDRIAQGADAFQLSKTLLLDPSSRADARPQLRIGADQVRCTHGATAGPLAPEQLHYLQSRGIPTGKATSMLVRGFLDEVTSRIEAPEIDTLVNAQVDRSLAALEAA